MLQHPWVLVLLLLVPLVAWRMHSSSGRRAVAFSSTEFASSLRPTLRQRLAWLPTALGLAALAIAIIALARPRHGREQAIIESEGIAIEMVVDRSGSMQAMDFQIDGQHVDRLTAIKSVAGQFVNGTTEDDPQHEPVRLLAGRTSDLVGLITFAGYADAITPPTLDHDFLISQLNHTEIVTHRDEDGTAIGDAISLAVEKLTTLTDRQQKEIKSKVVILLTDGENNAGEYDPGQAAELANKMGIRVYTIGVGTRGQAPIPVRSPLTGRTTIQWMNANIDEDTLKEIAQMTGGTYFRATDTKSLEAIYREIDEMEKSNVEQQRFVDYRELAIQPIRWGSWRLPPLVMMALVLLAARVLLSQIVFQELT